MKDEFDEVRNRIERMEQLISARIDNLENTVRCVTRERDVLRREVELLRIQLRGDIKRTSVPKS